MVYSTPNPKLDCLVHLKVYYGIVPYEGHHSRGSGTFYHWTVTKFGKELVKECEKELGIEPGAKDSLIS